MRPFDQLPFQWSVHVQRQPDAEPEHYEFLATDKSDPRREFITSLCGCTRGRAAASLSTPRSNRRGSRNLRRGCPSSRNRSRQSNAVSGTCSPSSETTSIIQPFAGSYSLKAVLPALVPEMSYEGMAVANGQDAGLAWKSLVLGGLDQSERDRTRRALLDYCGKDTLALVRLLETLRLH